MGASAKWIKSLIGFQKSNSNISDQVRFFSFFTLFQFFVFLLELIDFFFGRRRFRVGRVGRGSCGGVRQLDVRRQ